MVLATFEGGIDVHTIRYLSSHPTSFLVHYSTALRIKLLSFLVSFLVLFIYVAIAHDTNIRLWNLGWVFVMMASLAMIMHYRSYFRASDRFRYEAYSILLEKGLATTFGFSALLIYGTLDEFLPAFAVGYMLALALTIYLQFRLRQELLISTPFEQIPVSTGRMIREAMPFAFMNLILSYRIRISSVFLQYLGGRSDWVGYYNSGYRLVEAYGLIPSLLTAPLLPEFVRSQNVRDRIGDTLITSVRFLFVISVSTALLISLFGEWFIPFIFGIGYIDAIPSIRVIIWAIVPISANYLTGSLISAIGRQSLANRYLAAEFIILIGIYWVSITLYGFYGAAWATILTETIYFGFQSFVIRDILSFRRLFNIVGKLVLTSAVTISIVYLLSPSLFPFQRLLLAILLIPILTVSVRLVLPSELISIVKHLFNRRTAK